MTWSKRIAPVAAAAAIGIAPNGNVFVVGTTSSTDLPAVGAYSTTFQGASDAFVMGLDPTQTPNSSALIYSTFMMAARQGCT